MTIVQLSKNLRSQREAVLVDNFPFNKIIKVGIRLMSIQQNSYSVSVYELESATPFGEIEVTFKVIPIKLTQAEKFICNVKGIQLDSEYFGRSI